MSPIARLLRWFVRLYQRVTDGRPSPCRYVPTCSNYALDALEQHGAVRGSALTVRRLFRCHPWGGHGWDPVPEGKHR
jgi:putative membrane protein insertion efficiency factor